MEFQEQKKELVNGVAFPFVCHMQLAGQAGLVYPAHFHKYIEILFGKEGSFLVGLGGKQYEFGPGDMLIINSRQVHQIHTAGQNGGRYIVLRFEPELIYSSMSQNQFELRYILPFILEESRHECVISGEALAGTAIPALCEEALREFEEKEYGYELAVRNCIGSIYLWILRYWYRAGTGAWEETASDGLRRLLQPALDYILEHYEEEIHARELACLCGLSYSYFSRSFNRLMKMNFNEYVNQVRVNEAEKLLVGTALSVTEIAFSCGFGTTSYFIKRFRQYKKCSPLQFRKSVTSSLPAKDIAAV